MIKLMVKNIFTILCSNILFFWTYDDDPDHLVLIDFSLTVKAATLIFISGCVSSVSSAKQGKSGSFL